MDSPRKRGGGVWEQRRWKVEFVPWVNLACFVGGHVETVHYCPEGHADSGGCGVLSLSEETQMHRGNTGST